jgi:major vault protein
MTGRGAIGYARTPMSDRERERGRERDLVLAPNEFAFISDETKGNINVYVGPHKTSLANTDQPVVFDATTKRFDRCSLEQATRTLSIAPEGWYVVLKNPARDKSHPRTGALNNLPELDTGRKVNVPGPVSFALWPGQMARVLQGHHLRSNQYLLVRVYDEEAAKANWKNAVIKPQTAAPEGAPEPAAEGASLDPERLLPELTMGKQLIIRGTDVAFYIPPTGVEVVADAAGAHVREAATLERLEYCILLGEDGNKRYIQGPAVVFPRPTETFVERHGSRKFRAIELNENSGIYLKVIAPYVDEAGRAYKVGDELFLTGREQMIYFPRPEQALVRYGEQEIHYAVAIPAGEARYVLDRLTGQIRLQRGPCMFLPDPRREVIVRRVLDRRQVEMWFPGNADAVAHNQMLGEFERKKREEGGEGAPAAAAPAPAAAPAAKRAREGFAGDDFRRGTSFTKPRTIVLDTRFDGAVAISVWTGYAVLVVGKSGERKVVVGPSTYLLEYDETLQALRFSTGVPKSDAAPFYTVYLRVLNNKVSDEVEAETRDLCRVRLRLSYRVNFEGEPERWFDVENYVKFFTEHLRSLLRHAIRQYGVEAFYANAVGVVRDVVLGAQNEGGKRAGRFFAENGLRVYDVEVLDVSLGDETIAGLLVEAQHAAVRQALELAAGQRRLESARQTEHVRQQIEELEASTRQKSLALGVLDVARTLELELAKARAEAEARQRRREAELAEQGAIDAMHGAELARRKSDHDLALEVAGRQLEQRLRQLGAEVQATVDKAHAVSPDLVAALQAFGDRALAERMAQSMAPLAILGGESVAEVLGRLLQGTPLARLLTAGAPAAASGNGAGGE